MNWKRLCRISRPRFWLYVFGPFLLGCTAAGLFTKSLVLSSLQIATLILAAVFFLFPANLFVYGVNDLFDYETDCKNPKKQGYEDLIRPPEYPSFIRILCLALVPALIILLFVPPLSATLLALFLLLAYGYSAPPMRAKARPFIDTIFNGLYVLPGLFSYSLILGRVPSPALVIAALFWCMGMHAYSAIPDQDADRAAKIETVATVLGTKWSLIWCISCFTLAAVLAAPVLTWLSPLLLVPYLLLFSLSASAKKPTDVQEWYQFFPFLNAGVGFILFLLALFS